MPQCFSHLPAAAAVAPRRIWGSWAIIAIAGLLASGCAVGAATSVPSGVHPRMILDATTLASMRAAAKKGAAEWKAVKVQCDKYVGGVAEYPSGDGYPGSPRIGSGYQGSDYLPTLAAEALCYQVLKTSSPAAAKRYGARAVDILLKMSTPYTASGGNRGQNPCTDSGYGIRFYGVGFGLGYDWVHELLTAAQRKQVYTTANAWIDAWEKPGGCAEFAYKHPQSNYYAGYFHAKATIAIATYGENPKAKGYWSDWLGVQFRKKVQPYYNKYLAGGGWPEGFGNYADLGILNMTLPMREVKSATGLDLVTAKPGFTYPADTVNYAMHFAWPSAKYFDDRDTNHSNGNDWLPPVGTTHTGLYTQAAALARQYAPKLAGVAQHYRNIVNAATKGYAELEPWLALLLVDPSVKPSSLAALPRSYWARGMGAIAARSAWSSRATWMSFRAGPYTNNPNQGEEYFDQGAPSFVRGNIPLLVNASGWIMHEPGGNGEEQRVYDDNYGNSAGGLYSGNRQLYNIFYVRPKGAADAAPRFGQRAYTAVDQGVRTRIAHYEDGTSYVYVDAANLQDMYATLPGGGALVSAWNREIVYVRPNRFVVIDRTTASAARSDQYLAWHFPAKPSMTTIDGRARMDVTYGGKYAGAVTTVAPAKVTTQVLPLYPGSKPIKAWQALVRPATGAAAQQWVTVFDLSPSKAATATATPVTAITKGVIGTQMTAKDGGTVVVSAAAGKPAAGAVSYRVSGAAARHIVTGLKPGAGYTVTVKRSGAVWTMTLAPGGSGAAGGKSSAAGVVAFSVNAAGVLTR